MSDTSARCLKVLATCCWSWSLVTESSKLEPKLSASLHMNPRDSTLSRTSRTRGATVSRIAKVGHQGPFLHSRSGNHNHSRCSSRSRSERTDEWHSGLCKLSLQISTARLKCLVPLCFLPQVLHDIHCATRTRCLPTAGLRLQKVGHTGPNIRKTCAITGLVATRLRRIVIVNNYLQETEVCQVPSTGCIRYLGMTSL